jgi:CHAT domain-containing protein
MAVTLSSLGVAYRDLGRLMEARRAYAKALLIFRDIGDSREEARTVGNLGVLEAARGREEAALSHFDRAFERFRSLSDPPAMALTLLAKARVLRLRGDLETARSVMERSLAVFEEHRSRQTSLTTRAEVLATRQDLYDFLIDLLMEMDRKAPAAGHAAAALAVNERSLSRSLLDRLAANGQDLRASAPRDAALLQPQTVSAAEIQRELLDRDTLLLEYRLGDERSFLWAVTPDAVRGFVLPGRAGIEEVARTATDRLAHSQSRNKSIFASRQLAKLSRLLLDPAAPLLPGKRLVVVSDVTLQSLPFAALPEPGSQSGDGEPLVAHHEIITLPSISVLGELRREAGSRPTAPKTLWVLADPDFGDRFDPLPHTRTEAAEILKLVPARDHAMLLGRDASREAVLRGDLRDYRFLHFATHGSFSAEDPGGGQLVLAQVDPRGQPVANGFLHLDDIYKLHLRADLVVLSACQSGLGHELRGEGVMGMTRGFFYAGAQRVLVSLWNVNDRVTAQLMQRFYHGILEEGLSPAAALRTAQNDIRGQKRWQAPYYWAGFMLQGEWRGGHAR